MMLSPETGKDGMDRLTRALEAIPRREPISEAPPPLPRAEEAISLRQALLAPAEILSIDKCRSRILAEPCVSCPPAVPILISGERIDADVIQCFAYYGITELSCVREENENASQSFRAL